MNYFQFHIGDYSAATAHLSLLEDAIYGRLLRRYYTDEKPIPADLSAASRLVGARSEEEREAVRVVLAEFFKLTEDGWRNSRADREIDAYHRMKKGGANGASKRWAKGGDGEAMPTPCPPQANPNANHEPLTINQEPEEQKPPADKPPRKSKRQLAAEYPLPDWIDRALWARWIEGRTKPEAGLPENVAKLAAWRQQGHDPAHILREAIASGWQGLFLTKGTSHEDRRSNGAGSAVERVQAAIAAGRAAREYPGLDPSAIDGTVVASHG